MVMPSVHIGNKNTRVYSFNLQGLKDQNSESFVMYVDYKTKVIV